jgi:hypothetical protein
LINPNWELKFHVHTDTSQLIVGAVLAQNLINKFDQLVMYASKLLNSTQINYTTIEKEALAMVYVLHKFKHYLLGNWFSFYVDHMALVYLVNKP